MMIAEGSEDMGEEHDAWEQSARIVEAFADGEGEAVAELLARVAQAIRDKAVND